MERAKETTEALIFFSPGGDYTWHHVINSTIRHWRDRCPTVAVDFSPLDSLAEGFAPRIIETLARARRPEILGPKRSLSAASRNVEVSREVISELEIALNSAVMSVLRTTNTQGFLARRLRILFLKSSLAIYRATRQLIEEMPALQRVLLPNGRFPQQKAIAMAAREFDLEVLYYERSSDRSSFFMQPFMTTSISERHRAMAALEAPSTEILGVVKDRLESRLALEDSSNPFAKGWNGGFGISNVENAVVYFSSSQDEFWALGPEWEVDFESQYSGLSAYLAENQEVNHLIIRMHPNTLNKSVGYALNEVREVSRLSRLFDGKVQVIAPHVPANSYSLASACRRVIVWNSTVGLESLYLGKDVTFLAPVQFATRLRLDSLTSLEWARGTATESQVLDYLASSEMLYSKSTEPVQSVSPETLMGRILHICLSRPAVLWVILVREIFSRLVVRGIFSVAGNVLWGDRH